MLGSPDLHTYIVFWIKLANRDPLLTDTQLTINESWSYYFKLFYNKSNTQLNSSFSSDKSGVSEVQETLCRRSL